MSAPTLDRLNRHCRKLATPRDESDDELLAVLDEELARLPDRYRAPLIACYFHGRTQDEAARELGTSLSTLRRRLDKARDLLRRWLGRRGVELPAALLAVGLVRETVA